MFDKARDMHKPVQVTAACTEVCKRGGIRMNNANWREEIIARRKAATQGEWNSRFYAAAPTDIDALLAALKVAEEALKSVVDEPLSDDAQFNMTQIALDALEKLQRGEFGEADES